MSTTTRLKPAGQRRSVPISKVVVSEDEIAAVVEVLRSGDLREGPEVRAFEQEFADAVGARHALTASSGTSALQMAYQAIVQPGDEVLLPSFTFYATASVVMAIGAVPVFCEIDPEALTPDVADATRRVTARTRAIAPVHLFGNAADVDSVRKLAADHKLAVIWDAAQAHLTAYGGEDIGGLGDTVCYSFYPSKNMTTGEGGMVCTDSDELAERMKLLRSQGQSSRYVHVSLGYNFRLTDFQAALGRGQLRRLRGWTTRRQENAAYHRERFAELPELRVQREQSGGTHTYHQFTVMVGEHVNRDAVLQQMRDEGIGCEVYYPTPVHRQPVFGEQASLVSLPVSDEVARRVFSLPVHPHLDEHDREYVADRVHAAMEAARS